MRNLYTTGRAVLLGSLLVLGLVVGVSAPAWAVNVGSACQDFSISNPLDTRFDLTSNITTSANAGPCLVFGPNAAVYMNGFAVVGPTIDDPTNGLNPSHGIVLGDNSFLWGPGIVRGFSTCVFAGHFVSIGDVHIPVGSNHVAIEGIVTNFCGTGIFAGNSYKIKEVRVHDCLPSSNAGLGISLGIGGFIESSIVRNCETGVITDENNKIWNLVVTGHEFDGLIVATGNAVSRTVISQPRSSETRGLTYNCSGGGCQDGSNSVDGHAPGNNILGPSAGVPVVTQPQETVTQGATNCNGLPVLRVPVTGIIGANC